VGLANAQSPSRSHAIVFLLQQFAAYTTIWLCTSLTLLNPASPGIRFLYDSFIHYFTPVYPGAIHARVRAPRHVVVLDERLGRLYAERAWNPLAQNGKAGFPGSSPCSNISATQDSAYRREHTRLSFNRPAKALLEDLLTRPPSSPPETAAYQAASNKPCGEKTVSYSFLQFHSSASKPSLEPAWKNTPSSCKTHRWRGK